MESLEELNQLIQYVGLLKREALQGVVCPPDNRTPALINEYCEAIISYINQQKSK